MTENMRLMDRRLAVCVAISIVLSANAASGGTLRIDLPQLVGACCAAGQKTPEAIVSTSFDIRGVSSVRFVIDGTLIPGKAQGYALDGSDIDFDVDGEVIAGFSVLDLGLLDPDYTNPSSVGQWSTGVIPKGGSFHIDQLFSGGVFGANLMTMTGGLSLDVWAAAEIDSSIQYPALADPPGSFPFYHLGFPYHIISSLRINISTAYLTLTGPSVTPEPNSIALGFFAALGFVLLIRRTL